MAITGVFSGQMFNFLFGFSLSCIIKSARYAPLTQTGLDLLRALGRL